MQKNTQGQSLYISLLYHILFIHPDFYRICMSIVYRCFPVTEVKLFWKCADCQGYHAVTFMLSPQIKTFCIREISHKFPILFVAHVFLIVFNWPSLNFINIFLLVVIIMSAFNVIWTCLVRTPDDFELQKAAVRLACM